MNSYSIEGHRSSGRTVIGFSPEVATVRFRVHIPHSSISTLRLVCRIRFIVQGLVYLSWQILFPHPLRLRVLLDSRTSTRCSVFAVTPVNERFLVALTHSRVATRMICLRSKTLRTSKRFCILCSSKLSRLPGCVASSTRKYVSLKVAASIPRSAWTVREH